MAAWRVATVEALPNYQLKVQFIDGTIGTVNLSQLINNKNAGVFSVLADVDFFKQVYVELGVVTWPGEIDLAPDAMYEAIQKHGSWIL